MYASGQGRWLSPDPLMGHPFNPQTFDRYGYALGNPARFTDPTGQDPVYCEFVTIGGEFAGGGCDYTGGSSDYLNPYQQYDYNCLVYPAGCGYYNGMPVPNYPAYGGGGYTPPSQPPAPSQQQQYNACVAQAKAVEYSELQSAAVETGIGGAAILGAFAAAPYLAAEGVFEGIEGFANIFHIGEAFVPGPVLYYQGIKAETAALSQYDAAVAQCQTKYGIYP
jgi:hypothetical protein